MLQHQFSCFLGLRDVGKGHKVSHLTKQVHHSQGGGISVRWRWTGNKVRYGSKDDTASGEAAENQ